MKRVMVALILAAAVRVEAQGRKLPGAREVVDASRYETLQAAVDAVGEGGGVVEVPAGTFEVREPLVIGRSDVHLRGAGTGTHLKNVNAEGKPTILIRHPKGKQPRAENRIWRVELSGLRLTGGEKSGSGIEAVQVNEIFVHGVTISYHGGHGIVLDECYEDPRISDCLISYNKKCGLYARATHDTVVSANHFEENMDAVQFLDGFNLTMTGNNLDDHLGRGVVIEKTYGSVVSGNMIEECNAPAVVLDRDCYGITVSANVIAHNAGGVELKDAHGCAVSANTFTINTGHALVIGPGSGRITVTGNSFSESYVGGGKDARLDGSKSAKAGAEKDRKIGYGGILLDGASDITISGNGFSGLRPKALEIGSKPPRRVIFSGNVLTDVESDHRKLVESVVQGNIEAKQ